MCRSHGCRADTAAVQLVADRNLWRMAGRLQEIDTARGRSSTHTARCLGRDGEHFLNEMLCLFFDSNAQVSHKNEVRSKSKCFPDPPSHKMKSGGFVSDDTAIDSLLSYCDPGAQGSQEEVLKAKQPVVVLLRITGVGVRLVTSSMRVVFITAGVSVVWLSTTPTKTSTPEESNLTSGSGLILGCNAPNYLFCLKVLTKQNKKICVVLVVLGLMGLTTCCNVPGLNPTQDFCYIVVPISLSHLISVISLLLAIY